MKNTTIKDVAKKAGVSPSTVSRVISNSSRISHETQEKVRKAMKELGYHHNAIARSLVMQRTNTIGLVMARSTKVAFANPFFPDIIQGIVSIAQKKHFSLVLAAAGNYLEEQEEALKMLRNRKVDGIILMASRVNDELIDQLLENNYPFVLIGRSPEYVDIPIVNNNNIKASYDTVKYLLKKGYNNIAVLSGPEEYVVSQDRLRGYKKALEDFAINYNPKIVRTADFTYEGGYQTTIEMLKTKERLDAIYVFDDIMAFGALRAVQSSGLNIPDDLAIIGFNDNPLASYIKPSLTTVHIPIVKMGEEAARMLIRMICDDDYKGEEIIIPTELIVRESSL